MSDSDSRDKLERIRQARDGDDRSTDGPEVYQCPIDECSRTVIGNAGDLRNHVSQSRDDLHCGLKLSESLELVERYTVEDDLRDQYEEKQKSQSEIAEDWGCSRSTIQRWMDNHGIERRSNVGGGANRVEYATFYTETHENGGYETVGAYDPDREGMVWTAVHQLIAISEGADPYEVFSNGENQTHHQTGVPWDNRPPNIELLTREEHQRAHRCDEWTLEDGFPVLVTDQQSTEEDSRSSWGPGMPESHTEMGVSDSEDVWSDSVYDPGDEWGPGIPKSEV